MPKWIRSVIFVTALLTFSVSTTFGQIPDSVKRDLLIQELKGHLENERFREALVSMDKLRALGKKLPSTFLYFEAKAAHAVGDTPRALKAIQVFLSQPKIQKSNFYQPGLKIYLEIQKKYKLAEAAAWRKAKKGRRLDKIQAFLKNYPKSSHAGEAQGELLRLRGEANKLLETAQSFYQKGDSGAALRTLRKYEKTYGEYGGQIVLVRRKIKEISMDLPHQIGSGLNTMDLVPAGEFIMGNNSGSSNEKPRRRVDLDAFYIDKYPVTNTRFRRFGRPKNDYGSKFNGARQPVVGVTWFQARDYCKSVGKRLPTEAEWEKTARGVDGRKYPWGNSWDGSKVIRKKNSGGRTHPVDRSYNTHRSPYGAVDMVGNVWEWMADWYGRNYYRNAPERNPRGPASGKYRVLRGGSWDGNDPTTFRAADRLMRRPAYRRGILGFRCAKAP